MQPSTNSHILPMLQTTVTKIQEGISEACMDNIIVEEPLGIRIVYSSATGRMKKNIAVLMRTPGQDEKLLAGFLFTEGILVHSQDIIAIRSQPSDENAVEVTLKEGVVPKIHTVERNFYSSSGCGICGKASVDAIRTIVPFHPAKNNFQLPSSLFFTLPSKLRVAQELFQHTGGIHACALLDATGKMLSVMEDVGRHNALDKLIGEAWLQQLLPLQEHVLMLSGRAGFELIQKAAMAGIPVIASVGAPSSLAIETATEFGITLIGFLKNDRFNIYTHPERVIL